MSERLHPLAAGFYTVPEAARLIRVGSTRRIYGWLRGYKDRQIGPLLDRDYPPIDDAEELSFLDLMEVRFVEHFREHGVKAASLRRAAQELRSDYQTSHPFALDKVLLCADKADVYAIEVLRKSAEATGDIRLRSLTTRNYVMYEAIKRALLPGVEFDPDSHLTNLWTPMPHRFPRIRIDPRRAFGQPATQSGVPTTTLYDAWKAEKENMDVVADWFSLDAREVADAVAFEQALDARVEREIA